MIASHSGAVCVPLKRIVSISWTAHARYYHGADRISHALPASLESLGVERPTRMSRTRNICASEHTVRIWISTKTARYPHRTSKVMNGGGNLSIAHSTDYDCSLRNKRRKSAGIRNGTMSQSPSRRARERPSTGSALDSTRSNHGRHRSFATRSQVMPLMTSPDATELDPRTMVAKAALLSMKWIHKHSRSKCGHVSSTTNGPIASISKMSL